MKFQVIGQNRETGARMTLEFEAESKAAAERKALQQGMTVNRVLDVTDGGGASNDAPPRRKKGSAVGWLILLAILIVAAIYLWPRLKGML